MLVLLGFCIVLDLELAEVVIWVREEFQVLLVRLKVTFEKLVSLFPLLLLLNEEFRLSELMMY